MADKQFFSQKETPPPPPRYGSSFFPLTWDSILVQVFSILGAVSVLVLEPTFKFGQFPVLGNL